MFRNWAQSERVTRYLTWQPYKQIEEAFDYIQTVINNYANEDYYHWVITEKDSGDVIGSIGAVEHRDDIAEMEIGYCLSERFWGKGYMTEAFSAVIRYLFEEVGLNRILAAHDVRNPASGRVMEKCGLLYEGTLRQAGRNNQGVCDLVIRGILREEYQK